MCEKFVDRYGIRIIENIKQEAEPEKVCDILSLCSPDKDTMMCSVCEFVVEYAESTISTNDTATEIVTELKSLCDMIPATARAHRRVVKWSKDSVKNHAIVSEPVRFAGILKDMATDVTKLTGEEATNVLHVELMNVAMTYSKISDKTVGEETIECITRPLVKKCEVTVPSRRLMSVLYYYDIEFEGRNATELAYAVSYETVNASDINTMNLTVTSDQVLLEGADTKEQEEFNALSNQQFDMSDDGIFEFDPVSSNDVYVVDEYSLDGGVYGALTAPPPPASSGFLALNTYWFAGAGFVLSVMIGGALYAKSVRSKRNGGAARGERLLSQQQQFVLPDTPPPAKQSVMMFSTNPLHA
tara:strand:+ start:40 stop:1110 length:1071 start_codon:yes stop_codon:yes gene_type:complete